MAVNMRLLSFRHRIYAGFLVVFFIFVLLIFPLTVHFLEKIEEGHLRRGAEQVVGVITQAESETEMIARLRSEVAIRLFDARLYDADHKIIFDAFKPNEGAFYKTVTFQFLGKKYYLEVVFPIELSDLKRAFIVTSFILTLALLLLFGCLALWLVYYYTNPIKAIQKAIQAYGGGQDETIPEIKLPAGVGVGDEFGQLAMTLNLLSKKIESQLHSLTRERNSKAAILESLGEGVIAVDQAMSITYINQTALRFLHVERSEVLGSNIILLKKQRIHELIREAQGKNDPQTCVLQVDKAPRRYLDVIAVPRGKEGAVIVLQDKTALHRVVEMGRDFVANASHELKTPITIIRGFAETLHDHPELSKEMHKEITQKIVTNCGRMETLVRNLLTLAAVDEGLPSSRIAKCDLRELVQQARQMVIAVHKKGEITIEVQGEKPLFWGDGDLLLQAFINLLDNAVKYSKPPATVHVTVAKSNERIVISIKDSGIGIPHEELERVFERFYCVDKSHSRSLGGSGLGLSIVERIIEKHGGAIHVESQVGQGSIFTITFDIKS